MEKETMTYLQTAEGGAVGRYDGFSEFVGARRAALTRSAYLLTGDLDAAEELVQDALAEAAFVRTRRRPVP